MEKIRDQSSGLSARDVMDMYLSEDPVSEDAVREDALSEEVKDGLTQSDGRGHHAPTREQAFASVRPEERGRLQKAFGVLDRIIEHAAYSLTEAEFAATTVSEERIDRIQARLEGIRRQEWLQEAQRRWETRPPAKNTALQDVDVPLSDPVGALRHALALSSAAPARAMARQRPAEMKRALQAAQERLSAEWGVMARGAGDAAAEAEGLAVQFLELASSLRSADSHLENWNFRDFSAGRASAFQARLEDIASQTAQMRSLEAEVTAQQALVKQQQTQDTDPAWQTDRESAARGAVEQVRLPEDDGAAPVNVEKIAEDLGLFVKKVALDGFEGCLVTDGTVGGILIDAGVTDVRRQRFTLAHEIGHFLMHRSQGDFHDTMEDMTDFQSELELEANLFASHLLIPHALLPPAADGFTFADVDQIAAACGVSLQAAARRLIRHLDKACALVVLQDGQVRYYVGSRLFRAMDGHIRTKQSPHPDTAAAQVLAGGGEAGQATKQVPASLWIAGGPLAQEGQDLQEESRRLEDGYTYALLTLADGTCATASPLKGILSDD